MTEPRWSQLIDTSGDSREEILYVIADHLAEAMLLLEQLD